MAAKSYELIDMTVQEGTHPRIGGQDTIPLFPLMNTTVEECKELAEEIGKELFAKFKCQFSSLEKMLEPKIRRVFPLLRKGQYEGLKALLEDNNHPDYESKKARFISRWKIKPKIWGNYCVSR